jgi:hypothetical protein
MSEMRGGDPGKVLTPDIRGHPGDPQGILAVGEHQAGARSAYHNILPTDAPPNSVYCLSGAAGHPPRR